MKKYAIISKDLSTLIEQVTSHTAGLTIGSTDPHYHRLGETAELVEFIPAVANAFADENLSIMKMGLYYAYHNPMGFYVAAPAGMSGLIVPFPDALGATLKIYTPNSDARPFTDTMLNSELYDSDDCTMSDSITTTDSIFVASDTIWTLEPASAAAPSRFLLIGFNEDISSYLAD